MTVGMLVARQAYNELWVNSVDAPPPPAGNRLELNNPNVFDVPVGELGQTVDYVDSVGGPISSPGVDGGHNTGVTFT